MKFVLTIRMVKFGNVLRRMPFLTQPSLFILAWDRHRSHWTDIYGLFSINAESVPCCDEALTCSRSISVKLKDEVTLILSDMNVTQKLLNGWRFRAQSLYSVHTVGLYIIISVPELGLSVIWDKQTKVKIELQASWNVDPTPYYQACIMESCSCDFEGKFLGFCTAVAAYADACTNQNVCIKWRTPDLCRCYPQCPTDMPYYDENRRICSSLDKCTCYFNNTVVEPGAKVTTPSECCECIGGQLICGQCDVFGDPHYTTFAGQDFMFLENCTYVLVEERTPQHHLSISVDNYYCETSASCAKGIIVQYQNNTVILQVLEVPDEMPILQTTLNQVTIKPPYQAHGLRFESMDAEVYIYIKDIRSYIFLSVWNTLQINLAMEHFFNNTQGQCGVCGGASCIRRNGSVESDNCCDKTAYEWIENDPLKPYCQQAGQHVACSSNNLPTPIPPSCTAPLCDLLRHQVFSACSGDIDVEKLVSNCKFDYCEARNNASVCSPLERLADHCKKMDNACPEGMIFDECRSTPTDFCRGSVRVPGRVLDTVMSGCFCPENQLLAEIHKKICVSECTNCKGPLGEPMPSFLASLSFVYFAKAFQGSYMKSSVTQIERRFEIPSSQIGIIDGSFEIGNLLVIAFVSYFGAKFHRPRLIGVGCLIMAAGSFITALPHFFQGPYQYETTITHFSESNETESILNPCLPTRSHSQDDESSAAQTECEKTAGSALWVLVFLGNMVRGIGETPVMPLGLSYMDDFARKENTALYIDSISINHKDTRWVGAWWLGFLVTGAVMLLAGIPFWFLPRSLPKQAEGDARKSQEVDHSEQDSFIPVDSKNTPPPEKAEPVNMVAMAKDFLPSLRRLFSNSIYVLIICTSLVQVNSFIGMVTFKPKYMEQIYGQSPSKVILLIGIMNIPALALGIVLGGFVMKKFQLSVLGAAKMSISTCFIAFVLMLSQYFLHCGNAQVAGLTVSYEGFPNISLQQQSLVSQCNSVCSCSLKHWDPVCAYNGLTYSTPCLAGCQSAIGQGKDMVFHNCSCVAEAPLPSINMSAVLGQCPRKDNCDYMFKIYMAMTVLGAFVSASGATPAYIVLLRTIQPDLKSLALGMQMLIVRTLGGIPPPIYFGALIDRTCLKWGTKRCGGKGACRLYNADAFRVTYLGLIYGLSALAFLLWALLLKRISHHQQELALENQAKDTEPEANSMAKDNVTLAQSQPKAQTCMSFKSRARECIEDLDNFQSLCLQNMHNAHKLVQCDFYEEFLRTCDDENVKQTIRSVTSCEAHRCPGDLEYKDYDVAFPPTCSNPKPQTEFKTRTCLPKAGLVLNDRAKGYHSVMVENCPCVYKEEIYNPGQSRSTKCQKCKCINGKWNCSDNTCETPCAIEGWFVKTFDGKEYSLPGKCTYVAASGLNWSVTITVSDVRIGKLHLEVFQERYTFSLNSVQRGENATVTDLLQTENVKVYWQSSMYVMVQTTFGMKMQVQVSPEVQMYLYLPQRVNTSGLCGSKNNNTVDDFTTSSGIVENSAQSFAQSWSLGGCKADIPNDCSNTENARSADDKCSQLTDTSGVFAQCHEYVPVNSYYHACVRRTCDVTSGLQEQVCVGLGNYAKACASQGIIIGDWRAETACNCPHGQICVHCAQAPEKTAQRTCESLSKPSSLDESCISGCYCPGGQYADHNGKCVTLENCTCEYSGKVYASGKTVESNCKTW
ncbi:hypothetical protein QTP70_012610 [Hemibagrus guttatus]|uniref:Solute carrier organic anion transporter family member n=1 Tax=Hemibagrus guttatus TaxID=175788 RepID=A0AAE0QBS9_9TELE|nr:hypothetical protein QTP70_012610 [Hemibagrus guttatus]